MNKIISINLKGLVFQVEEEAFERLQKYLEQLNRHFANEESRMEIIDDIESRIAEMMQEILEGKAAITASDVDEIIAIMGNPADFGIDEEESNTQDEKTTAPPLTNVPKRFMRDTENSVLGGVCAGAGHYFGVDALWVRLFFLFLFFVFGTGIFFYIILWVIIPEAKTPSDRLQMRGEPVNVDTIEKRVKEEYDRVKKNFNNYGNSKKDPVAKAFYKVGGFAKEIILGFARVFSKILGFVLLFFGISTFIGFVIVAVKLGIDGTLPVISLAFEDQSNLVISMVAAGVFLLVSVLLVTVAALKLFNPKRKYFNGATLITTLIIGGISFFTMVTMGVIYGSAFSVEQSVKRSKLISAHDTVVVSAYNPILVSMFGEYDAAKTHSYSSSSFKIRGLDFEYVKTSSNAIINDSLWCVARLEVQQSPTDQWELEIIRSSYGNDEYKAQHYAEKIPLGYAIQDSLITLNTHFYVGNNTPYRDQEILYRLWVPKGKTVKFEQGVTEIMERGLKRKVTDPDYYGMTWFMGEKGLKCLDCKNLKNSNSQNYSGDYHREKDFTSVEVNIPAEVNIECAEEYSVYVSGPYEVRREIEVYKRGDKLKIDMGHMGIFDVFDKYDTDDVTITIKTPVLKDVEANGASKVYINSFKANRLVLNSNGASTIDAEFDADVVNIECSGSSKIYLKGKVEELNGEVTGASHLYAFGLKIENCDIETTGASGAEINVANRLNADASGASGIKYKGGVSVKRDVSGAAKIEKVD